ncbi:MAG: cation:dicarboxylase symporter family transporter, partial [Bacteroidia bacterium]|nr:cation:dicarboxylase symporter family transporter [Bacteroidia bacterium]
MNFKKNSLIFYILLSMVIGLVLGYLINLSITNNRLNYAETATGSITNPVVKEKVQVYLKAYEAKQFKEAKKEIASDFSILSDIFLHLIKMIIAPLVLAVLVLGVAKVGDFKSVGRIGVKTMIYFTSATLIALALGLVLVNVFEPGKSMKLDKPDAGVETGIKTNTQTSKNFIDHVIPESIVRSMAANDILPIVVFALFFGVAAAAIGDEGKPIIKAFDSLSHVMFKVTNFVMNFAPIGVFGAITAVVIQQGLDVLVGYSYLIFCFFGGLLFFVFVILFGVCLLFKINFIRLL